MKMMVMMKIKMMVIMKINMMVIMKMKMIRMMKMKIKNKTTYSIIKIIMPTNYQSKYINYSNSNNTNSRKNITTNHVINTKRTKNKYYSNSTLSKYSSFIIKCYKYLDLSLYITKCFNYKTIYSHRCAPQGRETLLCPSSWKIIKVQVNYKLKVIKKLSRKRKRD